MLENLKNTHFYKSISTFWVDMVISNNFEVKKILKFFWSTHMYDLERSKCWKIPLSRNWKILNRLCHWSEQDIYHFLCLEFLFPKIPGFVPYYSILRELLTKMWGHNSGLFISLILPWFVTGFWSYLVCWWNSAKI